MYIILVYDVEERKVVKVHKYLKTKINWIQNSVFEGEVTESELVKIKSKLKKMLNKNYDSVIIFCLFTKRYTKRVIIGLEKSKIENVL